MKDRMLIFYLGIILTGATTFTVLANGGRIFYMNGSVSLDEGLENVEDALILDSLEMDSSDLDTVYRTEDARGEIIFDDDFIANDGDTVKNGSVLDGSVEDGSVEDGGAAPDGGDLLSQLRKKDERWHLSEHVIKKGESIWTIARKYGTNHRYIIQINSIQNADHVKPGTKIRVPNRNGYFYTVEKGDTLSGISQKSRIKLASLQSHNNIGKGGIIRSGQKIFLPDAVKEKPKPKEAVQESTNRAVARSAASGKKSVNKTQAQKNGLQFGWPVTGHITSAFGMRNHPITGRRQFHNGIDIRAGMGSDIRASESGTVLYSGWKQGYGWMVVIKHPKNYITVYAHLSKRLKVKNDRVRKGEVIGKSGSSGVSTGPHLHFEIRKYETPLDPLRML
ncbi:MAG: peptidoglycan DD-metalloendopeptidase family protein [Spirochaetota bacterium]